MADFSDDDFERAYARDEEREPSRRFTRRPRPQLTGHGTLRAAHEDAELAKVCKVERVAPPPGCTRPTYRAVCSQCGFVGREYGPAIAGYADDEARDHRCEVRS